MVEPSVLADSRENGERRRVERRRNARVSDLTLPEVRRILITTTLGAVVMLLFLWMVRAVVIAAILGLIIGFYIRPLYLWILARTHRPTLPAILTALGAQVTGSVRIGDDCHATTAALRDTDADLIVTTGGTGGSRADHLRRALDDLGAEFLLTGIAARPGGPTRLARLPDGTLVPGLAGNPVAAGAAHPGGTMQPLAGAVRTVPATLAGPFWFCVVTFQLLLVVLLTLRIELATRQATLDGLYLEEED